MIQDNQITDETPIIMLTVGQLKKLIKEWTKGELTDLDEHKPSLENYKRYVYGLYGIASLFHVSRPTALKLKKGIIKPAVMQQGRKIVVDAEMAMELFRKKSER